MEKIKDSLKDGAVVTVQKEKGHSKIFDVKNSIGTQTKLHDKQDTLKTTKQKSTISQTVSTQTR